MEGMTKSEKKTLLIASCAASVITPMTGSMMNLSLVGIGISFNIGTFALAYINTIFLISSVIFMVPIAKIADMIGRKKVFVFGLIIYMIASFAAYFSISFVMLLVLRFIMGIGAAAMATTAMTMITDAFGPKERGSAIGYVTASVYSGLAMGPVLGGLINDAFGWRAVFFVTIPLAIVSLFAIWKVRPEIVTKGNKRFDLAGTLLYTAGISLTIIGLINLPRFESFVSMALGVMVLLTFVRYEKQIDSPVLNVNIFSNKLFSRSSLASFLINSANFSVVFFMALYLQTIGALSSSQAGMIMFIQPVIQTLFTAYFGKLYDRMKDKRILPTVGIMVSLIGISMMLLLTLEVNLVMVIASLIFFGLGNSVFNAPNTTATMSSVQSCDRGSASAMVAVVRQFGMLVSMGIAMGTISVVMGSLDALNPSTYGNFVNVIHISFIISLFMCILAMFASWFRGKPSMECTSVNH